MKVNFEVVDFKRLHKNGSYTIKVEETAISSTV